MANFEGLQKKKTSLETNNDNSLPPDNVLNWELVTDLKSYNQELKLDDENCKMPKIKIQDSYANYEPWEIFRLFFTDELIDHITQCTNEHMEKQRKNVRMLMIRKDRTKVYENFVSEEFKVYIGMKLYFSFMNNNNVMGKIRSFTF